VSTDNTPTQGNQQRHRQRQSARGVLLRRDVVADVITVDVTAVNYGAVCVCACVWSLEADWIDNTARYVKSTETTDALT